LHALKTSLKCEIEMLRKVEVADMGASEKRLHDTFESYKLHGEWFAFPPSACARLFEEMDKETADTDGQRDTKETSLCPSRSPSVSKLSATPSSSSSSSSSSSEEDKERTPLPLPEDERPPDPDPPEAWKSKPGPGGESLWTTGYAPEFEAWWSVYPRRAKKRKAWDAWQDAVAYLVRAGATDQQAHDVLQTAASEYAASPAGQDPGNPDFRPIADAWLTDRRFEDDPSEWQKPSSSSSGKGKAHGAATAGENFNPDAELPGF